MSNLLLKVPANAEGRDFVVGDIHGEYDKLLAKMGEVEFNYDTDRLFSVGDLVDRGPKNLDALELVREPWFYGVVGNHEDMMFAGILGKSYTECDFNTWIRNGGKWHTTADAGYLVDLVQFALDNMPLAIEIEREGGNIGIIHASPPDVWSEEGIRSNVLKILWDRQLLYSFRDDIDEDDIPSLPELFKIYMGHTPDERPQIFVDGKFNWIDTGAVYGGVLTMIEI